LLCGANAFGVSKKLRRANNKISTQQNEIKKLEMKNSDCQDSAILYLAQIRMLNERNDDLRAQLNEQKKNNNEVLNHLKDLSLGTMTK